jgi:hypothetical protein
MSVIKSAGPAVRDAVNAGCCERHHRQTALTLALADAGLLLRTTSNLAQWFRHNTGQLLNMTVTAVQGDWMRFTCARRVSVFRRRGAAFAWGYSDWQQLARHFEFEGQPPVARPSMRRCRRAVTPGYFNILRMALHEGRDFDSDTRTAPNVDRQPRTGGRYFDTSAVGKKVWRFGRQQPPSVIAVVANSGPAT